MKARVLLFDENEVLALTLEKILVERGYDVITFADRGVCPLFHSLNHPRMSDRVCSDIIISDLYMPTINGLKLIKDRIDNGCNVPCRALMSTNWSEAEWQYAREIGCRLFRKPFDLKELLQWLDACAQNIDSERKLFHWNRNKELFDMPE